MVMYFWCYTKSVTKMYIYIYIYQIPLKKGIEAKKKIGILPQQTGTEPWK